MTNPMPDDWYPVNERGFQTYAGGLIETDYGHVLDVHESSAAFGPHVWLRVSDSPRVSGHNAHLTLEEALMLRTALDQFIEGVPARWERGQEMLDEARRKVLGQDD